FAVSGIHGTFALQFPRSSSSKKENLHKVFRPISFYSSSQLPIFVREGAFTLADFMSQFSGCWYCISGTNS
ncbi:MAG TPA: hypothetical protein PLD60_17470, partial [Leptospiraceae bacterium]|nr:hypothetical protein [Leptospiraceae bacterium]